MAWNAALPGTSEKLRDISSVITQNWDEIEQGPDASGAATALEFHSIQLGDRSTIAASADPITDAGIFYQYAKNDGTNIEYFTKAPDGAIVQMSKGDVVAAASDNSDGSTYLPGGVVMKWGRLAVGAGATTAKTFAEAFPNQIYSVVGTLQSTSTSTQGLGHMDAGAVPSLTGFTWRNPTALTYNVAWIALGS